MLRNAVRNKHADERSKKIIMLKNAVWFKVCMILQQVCPFTKNVIILIKALINLRGSDSNCRLQTSMTGFLFSWNMQSGSVEIFERHPVVEFQKPKCKLVEAMHFFLYKKHHPEIWVKFVCYLKTSWVKYKLILPAWSPYLGTHLRPPNGGATSRNFSTIQLNFILTRAHMSGSRNRAQKFLVSRIHRWKMAQLRTTQNRFWGLHFTRFW